MSEQALDQRCAHEVCICCVCVLRESVEFGPAFSPDDLCCSGCHDGMADDGWPGRRCRDLTASERAIAQRALGRAQDHDVCTDLCPGHGWGYLT